MERWRPATSMNSTFLWTKTTWMPEVIWALLFISTSWPGMPSDQQPQPADTMGSPPWDCTFKHTCIYFSRFFLRVYACVSNVCRDGMRVSNPLNHISGFRDGCETPCWCWEVNQGPAQGWQVLLTADTSLQSWLFFFKLLLSGMFLQQQQT